MSEARGRKYKRGHGGRFVHVKPKKIQVRHPAQSKLIRQLHAEMHRLEREGTHD